MALFVYIAEASYIRNCMFKKFSFIVIVFILVSTLSFAQEGNGYTTALGVKFYPGAISLKHFVAPKNAIEGLAYVYDEGFRFTGLFEVHGDIPNAKGLMWYAGPGLHVGSYKTKFGGGGSFGVDGVIGLDLKISGAPLNFSLDWQPSVEFASNSRKGFAAGWGGLAIRYCIN